MVSWIRWTAPAIVVVGASLIGGCTSSTPSPSPPDGVISSVISPPSSVLASVPGDSNQCPSDYPAGLAVYTDASAEVPFIQDVTACTNAGSNAVWLKNIGTRVWRPTTSVGSAPVMVVQRSLRATSFAVIMQQVYNHVLLVPNDTLVVSAPPTEVTWDLDVRFSLAWEDHEWVADQLESFGEAAAVAALRRESPRAAALTACTLAGYGEAKKVPTLASASVRDIVVDGIGTAASGSACYVSWMKANRSEGVDRDWSRVERIGAASDFLAGVESHLDAAARLDRVIPLILHR